MKKKSKILLVGPGKRVFRTDYYIMKAFQYLGHSVFVFHEAKIYSLLLALSHILFKMIVVIYKPDIVFYSKANKILLKDMEWVRKKCTTIMWYYDLRIPIERRLLDRAKRVDLFYITNKGQIPQLLDQGANAKYLTQACITDYTPTTGSYKYEVSFVGNNNITGPGMREELLNLIGSHFELHVFGARWSSKNFISHPRIFSEEYANVCARSKIVLDIKSFDYCLDVEGYFSNRTPLTLGFGGFLLSQYTPGVDQMYQDRKHLVYFKSPEEAISLIEYYLNHEDERKQIAEQGKEYVLKNHTYIQKVEQIIRDIEQINHRII